MIKPLNGYVVLKKTLKEKVTESGIVLTQKNEEEDFAYVVAVSDSAYNEGKELKIEIKEGDKVFFKSYSSTKIKENDEEYLLVSYKDILAVIK